MINNRSTAKSQIEKLVRYFEQNTHQLKAASFNEAQTRQYLIDPFFEAFGWDVSNKKMEPPYRLEVLPEGRVKTSLGKVVKEQQVLFSASTGVKEEMKEYASMLEYIADDEYKADSRLATKKPDYRFRIGGSTKFFVEAKKPSVDLINNTDAIFQIKRYGFSARVPVSVLTDFEEFRVFDCTRKPFYDKPKIGVLKEFDLSYNAYLDEFEKLYDTFSRDAVVAGSIEALQKKYLEKRTGEFTLDHAFLDDLSEWRVKLAQDIARHPKNRRILNTYTLNECVQRILDRIVFLRVCEDRNIEVERTLLELQRVWQDHPGLSLYEKFNELIKARRSLYNGLLFAEHACEQLEVGNKILEEMFKNINYPLSPYHFDEIGVEILGSIYERFLGKTIRLTKKQVRIEEKPEVRKAGGVYYTPQYIVNYIVENTLGRLLYDDLTYNPLLGGEDVKVSAKKEQVAPLLLGEGRGEVSKGIVQKLKLSPKQISKLKIVDIACGSGSFLLGAFQMLIDYHVQWYTQHPDDIKEVHGVRDVYEDPQGRLVLSARKKREVLINNIYGVDIDPQAVEVTQMSLYLKVLEDENDATLNKPTMLALHEVLLPPLKDNIKCGNSLIGTDFLEQGELFDEEARRKVNPFDWETEFKEIMESGGFDCVIGNPPYGAFFEDSQKSYLFSKYLLMKGQPESYEYFIYVGINLLKKGRLLSYIVPTNFIESDRAKNLRKFLLNSGTIHTIQNFRYNVWLENAAEALVLVYDKQENSGLTKVVHPRSIEEFIEEVGAVFLDQKEWEQTPQNRFLIRANTKLIKKIEGKAIPLEQIGNTTQGIIVYKTRKESERNLYISKKKGPDWVKLLDSDSRVFRYGMEWGKKYLKYGEWLWCPRDPKYFESPKILFVRLRNKSLERKLVATYDEDKFYNRDNFNNIIIKDRKYSLKYILALFNSKLINYWYKSYFDNVNINPAQVKLIPIRTIDFTKPEEKQMHDELVALVDRMLELHKQLNKASFDSEKEPIQRQIAATDRKIDQLVYRLYNLTEEEIKIVDGK